MRDKSLSSFPRNASSLSILSERPFLIIRKAEFVSKIGDCLKEIEETEHWLELIAETGSIGKAASLWRP
jgi:hypothetical protein